MGHSNVIFLLIARERDRQAGRQAGRETDRQRLRQRNRQRDMEGDTDRQTNTKETGRDVRPVIYQTRRISSSVSPCTLFVHQF